MEYIYTCKINHFTQNLVSGFRYVGGKIELSNFAHRLSF